MVISLMERSNVSCIRRNILDSHIASFAIFNAADNTADSTARVEDIEEINLFRPARECRRKKTFFSEHRCWNTTYCVYVSAFATRRHRTQCATSYLISSSSSSSSASIAAEIAARCLPWAQRRQLLIYRDRTTEPLTPASTRSIPIAIVILSASHVPLYLSPDRPIPPAFAIEFAPKWIYRCYRGIGRFLPVGPQRVPEWVWRRLRQYRNRGSIMRMSMHMLARM